MIRHGRFILGFVASVCIARLLFRWQRRWGASDSEVTAQLIGDDIIDHPARQITRAIAIDAPSERVWPWLVQIGADKGGFYSYDWLENAVGLQIHSADRVVPEWQNLAVGDFVAAERKARSGWIVERLVPHEALVLQMADLTSGLVMSRHQSPRIEFTWTFALDPRADGTTRLLVRERWGFGSRRAEAVSVIVELTSFVMSRKMMIGVSARAAGTKR